MSGCWVTGTSAAAAEVAEISLAGAGQASRQNGWGRWAISGRACSTFTHSVNRGVKGNFHFDSIRF